MTVIADSSSTSTEWVLIDGGVVVEKTTTQGLNPFFMARKSISHIVRLELPEIFFRGRWKNVFFYGAGCSSAEKKKIVESSLSAQFKSPARVESDLEGAARGLFGHSRGIACIIGIGSNSCVYNGSVITQNVCSGGYLLGDEGSEAALGRIFISDCIKNLAPADLCEEFFDKYLLTAGELIEEIYAAEIPSKLLSKYSYFLAEHTDNEYVRNLITRNFQSFFERHLLQYDSIHTLPVRFVGHQAWVYADVIRQIAEQHDIRIAKIAKSAMPGLISYHTED